jgi:hypothetical protein
MWSTRVERAEKAELITALQSSFKDAGSIVVARNTGLTVRVGLGGDRLAIEDGERHRRCDSLGDRKPQECPAIPIRDRIGQARLVPRDGRGSSALLTVFSPCPIDFSRSTDAERCRPAPARHRPGPAQASTGRTPSAVQAGMPSSARIKRSWARGYRDRDRVQPNGSVHCSGKAWRCFFF